MTVEFFWTSYGLQDRFYIVPYRHLIEFYYTYGKEQWKYNTATSTYGA